MGVVRPKGRPYVFNCDTTNRCNLRCPFCETGKGRRGRPGGCLSADRFRAMFEAVRRDLFLVNLYNWGEPLLNQDIFDIIRMVHDGGVASSLSSNMNLVDEEKAGRLVEAGLDYLIASIDGATESGYAAYQRGGTLARALDGLRRVVEAKRRLKSSTPVVDWQFVVFRQNEGEIDAARRMAREIGADRFTPIPSYVEDAAWEPLSPAYRNDPNTYFSIQGCRRLWTHLTIHWDGSVAPCCWAFDRSSDFGNLLSNTFEEVWWNEKFTAARREVLGRGSAGGAATICGPCIRTLRPPIAHERPDRPATSTRGTGEASKSP